MFSRLLLQHFQKKIDAVIATLNFFFFIEKNEIPVLNSLPSTSSKNGIVAAFTNGSLNSTINTEQ